MNNGTIIYGNDTIAANIKKRSSDNALLKCSNLDILGLAVSQQPARLHSTNDPSASNIQQTNLNSSINILPAEQLDYHQQFSMDSMKQMRRLEGIPNIIEEESNEDTYKTDLDDHIASILETDRLQKKKLSLRRTTNENEDSVI